MSRSWDILRSVAAGLTCRLTAALRRRQRDRDLDDELRHHLALRAEAEAARGSPPSLAHRTAIVRFGSLGRLREETRDASRFVWLADLFGDARHGAYLLMRHPLFAGVAVAILSLGVGISVSIFGAMNALLFRPVPGLAMPSRLVAIGRTENGAGFDLQSYPNAVALRDRNTVLSDMAVYSDVTVALDAEDSTVRARGQRVSVNYFQVIGSAMSKGRAFSDADDHPGSAVAIVSEAFWTRAFGSRTDIENAIVRVNRVAMKIVGVAPPGFQGVAADASVDLWLPLTAPADSAQASVADDPLTNPGVTWLWAIGRLKPGVSIGQARASLRGLGDQLAVEFPDDNAGRGVAVEPVAGVGPVARATLLRQWTLLNGFATLVLLVVCLNVANMMLSRSSARSQEMRVRLALGAGRPRLVRQLLAEHLALAMLGGLGGVMIAWWVSAALPSVLPRVLLPTLAGTVLPDWRVFVFTAAVVVAASIICAAPQAWTGSVARAGRSVNAGIGPQVSPPTRLRTTFAVVQVALSLGLLISASLLGRSLQKAGDVDLGFDPQGIVTAYYDLEAAGYTAAGGPALHARLLDAARQWRAVEEAALGQHVPLQGSSLGLPIEVPGLGTEDSRSQLVRVNVITPGFFRTLRTPVLSGREFLDDDRAGGPQVAVVNETCRRQCFGGEDPVGRRILMWGETIPREIVGVVRDGKYSQPLEEIRPTVFVPATERYSPRMGILLRTGSPATVAQALAREMRRIDPALPIYDVRTLEDRLALALWQPRMMSALVAAFGLLSLALAVLGIYGVVAQTAALRRPEIAVRMALGAEPGTILRMVLRHALTLVALGVAIGAGLALAMSSVLRTFLYGVEPLDPVSFGLATLVLATVTLATCLIPARRAARANLARVLRN